MIHRVPLAKRYGTAAIAMLLCCCSMAVAQPSSPEAEPSFFSQFIVAGGKIVWLVLLPMSVATIALTIEHCLSIRRRILLPTGITRKTIILLNSRSAQELIPILGRRTDFLSFASAVTLTHTLPQASGIHPRDLLVESLQEKTLQLLRKIEWLSILGNVAPMVGLFGTVFGMIMAFNTIAKSGGQAGATELAGGISIALVTTFWGLLVAIPALAAHGIFRNRIETISGEAAVEAEMLLPHISSLIRRPASPTNSPSENPAPNKS